MLFKEINITKRGICKITAVNIYLKENRKVKDLTAELWRKPKNNRNSPLLLVSLNKMIPTCALTESVFKSKAWPSLQTSASVLIHRKRSLFHTTEWWTRGTVASWWHKLPRLLRQTSFFSVVPNCFLWFWGLDWLPPLQSGSSVYQEGLGDGIPLQVNSNTMQQTTHPN